jgi:hypothetical protein
MVIWHNAAELQNPWLRLVLYGPTGSGKSHIAAGFPKPLFVFPRNENSKETIRGLGFPYTEVGGRQQMNDVLDELLAFQRSGRMADCAETVIVESLSHYSELVEMELTEGGTRKMDFPRWGLYTAHLTHIRDVLWQLDAHVILTMLDKQKTDAEGNVVKAGVRLYGQSADLIPASSDALGYCEQVPVNPPQWQVHFRRFGPYDARTRIRNMAPGTYPNFSFAEHLAPILNGHTNPAHSG